MSSAAIVLSCLRVTTDLKLEDWKWQCTFLRFHIKKKKNDANNIWRHPLLNIHKQFYNYFSGAQAPLIPYSFVRILHLKFSHTFAPKNDCKPWL